MDISLTKLPWYAQIGAFVALAGAGVFVFYTYYEKPVREEMAGREKQLTLIKKDITKGRSTARKLDEFRTQVDDLESRLAGLRAVLPEEKDAAELLRSMQTVAVQSNLRIKAFKPAEPVTKQLHAEWPIELEIEGTYHNLAVFFDRIGRFTRIVNVSGLAIEGKDKPTANVTISAKCIATTFVLLDAPKAPVKGAKGGKPDKSGKSPEAGAKGAA
jgi:type IV pilus assembly protein PilO